MSWQIPAGPPAQPTLVPWKTMQEELPNALGADDESLPDHCQCAPLKVIYYSQYCLGSANNSCTSQLAAPACSSQRKQSGHWSTMWVFFQTAFSGLSPLFGVPEVAAVFRAILKLCFCQRRAAMLCLEIPAQQLLHISWAGPDPARALLW